MRVTSRASAILLAVVVATATGCGQRQVEVRTAPTAATEQAVQVTNNLSQAVNVYVTGCSARAACLSHLILTSIRPAPVLVSRTATT